MCVLLQALTQPRPSVILPDLASLHHRVHHTVVVGELVASPAHTARARNVPTRHDAQLGERPVEAFARPIAAPYRLVDPRRDHHLGRDLTHPLGQANLAALDAQAPLHALRVDGVGQPIGPLQIMDDSVAAPTVVAVADRLAVEPDPRRHDVDVPLGVRHDDVGRVAKAHL